MAPTDGSTGGGPGQVRRRGRARPSSRASRRRSGRRRRRPRPSRSPAAVAGRSSPAEGSGRRCATALRTGRDGAEPVSSLARVTRREHRLRPPSVGSDRAPDASRARPPRRRRGRSGPAAGLRSWRRVRARRPSRGLEALGGAPPGSRSCATTPRACTGWPTACRATRRTPRTSPRRRSSGCSARWPTSRPAPSRAGCTASRPTCSSTWCGAASGSASTRCPRTPSGCPARAPSPEQVYADTHLDPQIQAALDALSPEFRVAVVLCDIEGLTYEEIAATLGIKLGTVRSRIHRGRVQLRQALAHLAPGRVAALPS